MQSLVQLPFLVFAGCAMKMNLGLKASMAGGVIGSVMG